MAFQVIWSKNAREDLRQITQFIAQHDPATAARVGFQIIKAVDSLENFPHFGRRVPEFGDESIREIVRRPYRIIYLVRAPQSQIAIVRVWHGARGEPRLPDALEF